MKLTDFVTAHLGRAERVVWCGLPDHRLDGPLVEAVAHLVELDPDRTPEADASRADALREAGTFFVQTGEVSLERLVSDRLVAELRSRPVGSLTALVARVDAAAPVEVLAGALAAAGQQVVHVVRLEGSPADLAVGVSLQRTSGDGVDVDGDELALTDANTRRLSGSPLAEQTPRAAEGDVEQLVEALLAERASRRAADARAAELERELLVARGALDRFRRSASVQIGRSVAEVLDDPARGIRALPGRVSGALKARADRRGGAADAAGGPGGAGGTDAPHSSRPLPPYTGRRRAFDLRLPDVSQVPGSAFRRSDAPSTMRVDVPYPFFIPLRLERDGLAGYEPETLAWWLALCDEAEEGVVWDIGANTGLFAALAAATTTREVVAFEPTPDLALWARALGTANDLDYVVEQVAAADADGTATFFLSDSTDSSSSLKEGFRKSSEQLDVLTERLDTYQRRTGQRPALLKVDTETTEPAVLRGAGSVIAEHRPWILCEVLANCGVEEPLMELAQEWGYHWYHLTEELPPPSPERILGDITFEFFMYLLSPEPVSDAMVERVRAWRSALAECRPDPGSAVGA